MSSIKSAAGTATKAGGGFASGFREFVMRGNVVDLAVAVVLGAAFAGVVKALVEGVINPLVGAIFGKPNLDNVWIITINGANIAPGMVLTQIINFVLVALAIYAFIIVPMHALAARRRKAAALEEATAAPAADIVLLTEIRDLLDQPKR